MKRILTIICAIAFSGAALSAQNDTIKSIRTFANPAIGLDIARFSDGKHIHNVKL